MNKVFVYGTLKQGKGNHQWYLTDSNFLGSGSIEGYDLYDLGPFPAIVPQLNPDNSKVYGELYEVTNDVLAGLNGLEGYREHAPDTGLYDRADVIVTMQNGEETHDALVYFMRAAPESGVKLDEGVWK